MIEPRRDWGEYVYQSDLDVTLYEATTRVYALADVLRQIKYGTNEMNCQGPQHSRHFAPSSGSNARYSW